MPTINPSLVPTVAPGNLFQALTTDSTLNVRWITPTDPVYYEAINRPMADITLRQLILAKTLDNLSISMGHEVIFPFLIQAKVANSTTNVQLPNGWVWDMHMSTPARWADFRLAKIKRLAGGTNPGSTGVYTGKLRLVFTAIDSSIVNPIETALFYADYEIDSALTYQRLRLSVCNALTGETNFIPADQADTINGFITFRTLLQDDPIVQAFYDLLAPSPIVDVVYEIVNTGALPTELNSYSAGAVSHGTGMLVDSCNNAIPAIDSDSASWLNAFNYPFGIGATRTSTGTIAITIPSAIFREFNIVAPAGDEPTGDTSGYYYPVWVSRIEVPLGSTNNHLILYFATHNTTISNQSPDPVEFAKLELFRTMVAGEVVTIQENNNLLLQLPPDSGLYYQLCRDGGLGGCGHVVLSSTWDTAADDFFYAFQSVLVGESVTFLQNATRISSFGISRVPLFMPTQGQWKALVGTTSRLATPIPPYEDNLFVTEMDQGLGNTIDLDSQTGIISVDGISRYGNTGGLVRRTVQLCIDYTKLPVDTTTDADIFYETYVLPRLIILLGGRSPIWGDEWYNGTTFLRFNGDTWQSI